jgi:3',5'-cyclic AMP phosphodiesterase CpdA
VFTLCHISDPHLGPLAAFRARELFNKRITGYANWWRSRRHVHDMAVLDLVIADILAHAPDHVACTGDVAHIGLPTEFHTAIRFLDRLGPRPQVSFVPGNHDAYVRGSMAPLARELAPWTTSDSGEAGWPFLKIRGGVALIGLDTGIPTLPLQATGRLGQPQIDRAEALLHYARGCGLARVILIHHPPHLGGAKRGRELLDAAAFEAMLARAGADLVLHGHNHTTSLAWRPGPDSPVPIIGVPSASMSPKSHHENAGWHLIRIKATEGKPKITVMRRGLLADGTVGELGEIDLRHSGVA